MRVVAALAAFGALAIAPSAALADPTPDQALAELNQWRAASRLAPVTTLDPVWDTGCHHHNQYEQQNNVLTHYEDPSRPGYTSDGAQAGPDSVLATGYFADPSPRSMWDAAVFHRVALLAPRLRRIGYDAWQYWYCLWDQNVSPSEAPRAIDNSPAARTAQLALYPSPANGQDGVPVAFPGTETPDPETEDGVNGAPLGWLISVSVNGPWPDGGYGGIVWTHVSAARLAPEGGGAAVPLAISEHGTTLGTYMREGFGLFPLSPLVPATVYRATVSGTAHDAYTGAGWRFTSYVWRFRTVGAPPFTGVQVLARTARVRGRLAPVAIACPPGAGAWCAGSITLRRGARGGRLASRRFFVRTGAQATLSLRLLPAAQRALATTRRLRVTATVVATDALGVTRVTTARLTLILAGRPR
jgi:hypothetical protein